MQKFPANSVGFWSLTICGGIMGQIFEWEQVRRGQIPRKESFDLVASQLNSYLWREPAIVAALIFGSVVRGDSSLRSDIDCVVLFKTEEQAAAMRTMQLVDGLARAVYVPINFVPCDTVLAQTRLHHLGTSFMWHLQSSIEAGGAIKGNISELIAPTCPIKDEIESYIKMKMYSIQESYAQITSFSDERYVGFLKKAMESPIHVARKMLAYEGRIHGDAKSAVRAQYRETMPTEHANLLDRLLSIDARYTAELESQMRLPNKAKYVAMLIATEHEIPNVIKFLRINILRLNATTR